MSNEIDDKHTEQLKRLPIKDALAINNAMGEIFLTLKGLGHQNALTALRMVTEACEAYKDPASPSGKN